MDNNKLETALIELLKGMHDYCLYPMDVKGVTVYILDLDTYDNYTIVISKDTYDILTELGKRLSDEAD